MHTEAKLKYYYIIAVLSLIFAVVGFGYNAWRLEVSEDNNTIRTASFEVLKQLSRLEQIIYALHYDKNRIQGSPRNGWVAIGLITDLSLLVDQEVDKKANQLKNTWADNWGNVAASQEATDLLVGEIDGVRLQIKQTLIGLE